MNIDKLLSELYAQITELLHKYISQLGLSGLTQTGDANFSNLDPYAILGLKPDATDEEIDTRYKYLMKHLHPDVCPGMTVLPMLVNIAYQNIKSKRK